MAIPPGELETAFLAAHHDRAAFFSGVESLDTYFRTQAGQDIKRKANAVFVLCARSDPAKVLGFYTLCASAIQLTDLPEPLRKHVPRYPMISATLIGRLAIAQAQQGNGLGSIVLADARRRAVASAAFVGSSLITVDAIDERAARFYLAHGFIRLPDSRRLILPMRLAGG
jgi:ribosomal protein S18 acetylase RimI-like enzyme